MDVAGKGTSVCFPATRLRLAIRFVLKCIGPPNQGCRGNVTRFVIARCWRIPDPARRGCGQLPRVQGGGGNIHWYLCAMLTGPTCGSMIDVRGSAIRGSGERFLQDMKPGSKTTR